MMLSCGFPSFSVVSTAGWSEAHVLLCVLYILEFSVWMFFAVCVDVVDAAEDFVEICVPFFLDFLGRSVSGCFCAVGVGEANGQAFVC